MQTKGGVTGSVRLCGEDGAVAENVRLPIDVRHFADQNALAEEHLRDRLHGRGARRQDDGYVRRNVQIHGVAGLIDTRLAEIGGKAAGHGGDGNDVQMDGGTEPRPCLDAEKGAEGNVHPRPALLFQILLGDLRHRAGDAVDLQGVGSDRHDVARAVPFDGDEIVVSRAVLRAFEHRFVDGGNGVRAHGGFGGGGDDAVGIALQKDEQEREGHAHANGDQPADNPFFRTVVIVLHLSYI